MTRGDAASHGHGLTKRSWTIASGVVPLIAVATIAAACACAVLPLGHQASTIAPVVVILLGLLVGFLWRACSGAAALHHRITAARAEWARSWRDATTAPDGAADPRDVVLALPRGWRVEAARGRLRLDVAGTTVQAETWVLRAVVGSRRAPRRREIVQTRAQTDGVRAWVPLGVAADSMLVTPAWGGSPDPVAAAWLAAVRDRVARHEDVLSSLTIGDDRVILFALDDPRPETMLRRAELVRDVAAIIQAAHSRP